MSIPLLDLQVLHARQDAQIQAAIQRVLLHQGFILGPEVAQFEAQVAQYLVESGGGAHVEAIGVANGSDALILAMLGLGVEAGDEVILPAFTFVSTGTSVALIGARPVFADVDDQTFNLDIPHTLSLVTPKTRAVIAVHLFGRSADIPALRAGLDAMRRPDIRIIEDAAQALGARLDGHPVCTMGDAGCISFFPSKNLGCYGDGGMVTTPHAEVADRIRMLRAHGSKKKYYNELLGYNSRLDALQAAILGVKLPALDGWCAERRANAQTYRELFDAAGLAQVILPQGDGQPPRFHHIYNQFTLRVTERDALETWLKDHGIGTAVYYPRALSTQPCFDQLNLPQGTTPVSDRLATEVLSVPIYPGLVAEQQRTVVDTIAAFYRR